MKIKMTYLLLLTIIVAISCKPTLKKDAPSKTKLKSEVDSVSYAIGYNLGKNFQMDNLDSLLNKKVFYQAMEEGMADVKSPMDEQKAMAVVQKFMQAQFEKKNVANKEKETKFLAEAKKKSGVVALPSGLMYEVVKEGSGAKPLETSTVKVHYKGTLSDGSEFDSSLGGEPAEFPLNGVIKGWTEGLQLMNVGSKYKFYIPSDLAYGPSGNQVIGPYEPLTFEVELLEIVK